MNDGPEHERAYTQEPISPPDRLEQGAEAWSTALMRAVAPLFEQQREDRAARERAERRFEAHLERMDAILRDEVARNAATLRDGLDTLRVELDEVRRTCQGHHLPRSEEEAAAPDTP